jgi:hypothetical protein
MNKLARSVLTLLTAGGLVLAAAGPALASGGGGGSSGNPDPVSTTPACIGITLNTPQVIGNSIRWTGSATNCSTAPEHVVLNATDVSGAVPSGCTLAPMSYGWPSQAARSTVYWYMTSKSEPCAGPHTEKYDVSADGSSVPTASQTVTFVTT